MVLRSVLFSFIAAAPALAQVPVPATPPAPLQGLKYDAEFFPGSHHDEKIPTPDSVLGFRLGEKAASHAQMEAVIKAIAQKSPRVKLFEYATSHEGRKLYYLAVSSEENIKQLDAIKSDAAKLGDPRGLSQAGADAIVDRIPAIAWMAYCIHGDEMSGTDAALALLWHLASCTDADVAQLLHDEVVLIDPLMNPDGRDRCITNINQNRTVQPAVDEQSIIHSETWPGGRTNHYLFDMNRDWIWCTQPETRGRVKAIGEWNPHYLVESHEQEPLDTFLFMPPRAPVNPNIPESLEHWSTVFGDDQGKAFDTFGWRYYTGEWNEEWYPGYSGSWAALRGAIDNLYEQARIVTDAVRRPEGTLEPYREAVHKQLVSSLANLRTLRAHRKDVVADFAKERRDVCSDNGPYAKRLFVLTGGRGNGGSWTRLKDLLSLQGIEVYALSGDLQAGGHDWLGRELKDKTIPRGSIVVPGRQPLGRLAAALFELDPHMTADFLKEERRELLRFGNSRLYDITAWNTAMMFGIEVQEFDAALPAGAKLAVLGNGPEPTALGPMPAGQPQPTAWFADGNDDRSIQLAARLLDRNVKLRCTSKPTKLGETSIPRGSFIITRKDNQAFQGDLLKTITEAAALFHVPVAPLVSGMGAGDLPDIGGQYFVLLETPRIAILTGDPFGPYSVGEVWHLVDHELGLRAALIPANQLDGADLRRYNVLVIPDGGAGPWTDKLPAIKAWVEAGGTLIAIGGSAAPVAKDKTGIGSVRLLPDVITKLDAYRAAIVRDWLAKNQTPDPAEVWSNTPPEKLEYPWNLGEQEKLDDDEAKRRDQWRDLFMPTGAILAARVDDRHWLTGGCGEVLPVTYGHGPVLLAASGGNAPLLMGAFVPSTKPAAPKPEEGKKEPVPPGAQEPGAKPTPTTPPTPPTPPQPAEKSAGEHAPKQSPSDGAKPQETKEAAASEQPKKDGTEAKKDEKKEEPKPGWLLAPPGYELRLRMSGLLWPEAADRIANSAYCTQERIGNGQVILFSNSPTFRAAARGSTRVMSNALICGPGMGASQPIRP
jgi:hypothetical protein